MIIIDSDKYKNLFDVLLLLKKEEALELKDALEDLLELDIGKSHIHVSNENLDREINIMIYNPDDNPDKYSLHEKVKNLIVRDGIIMD